MQDIGIVSNKIQAFYSDVCTNAQWHLEFSLTLSSGAVAVASGIPDNLDPSASSSAFTAALIFARLRY